MQSDNQKNIVNDFEKEIWLYLDNDLPKDRMIFWNEQLRDNHELLEFLNETKAMLTLYDNSFSEDISDAQFNKFISTAVKKRRLFEKLKSSIASTPDEYNEREITLPKIAFALTILIAAIVLLIVSDKPNAVKTVSNEILDWEATSITNTIDKMGVSISYLKNDNFYDYYRYQQTTDKWSRDVYLIKKKIEDLRIETINNN